MDTLVHVGQQNPAGLDMTRNRASAKSAGTAFETLIARHLAVALDDDRVERRARTGGKDRGDIAGVRVHGQRLTLECKDYGGQIKAAEWLREAAVERGNDDGLAGAVVIKRRGTTDPAEQFVLMDMANFVALLTGQRPEL